MGQIVFNNQEPVYCNLTAITTGNHKTDVPAVGQIWLVDSKNLSKPDGTGKYDKYIVGDAEHHTAKWLAENDLRDIDNISGEIPSDVYSKSEVNTQFAALYNDDDVVVDPDFNAEADTVWHKPQVLSNAQKAQARNNIGASDFDGNYNSLRNKPTSLSDFSGDANHRTVTDAEKLNWNNANALASSALQPVEIVEHGTGDTTFTLTPNKFHIWGEVESLNLSLGATSSVYLDEFLFQFTSGSTATVLSLPNNVMWMTDSIVEANKVYQVSIVNNIAVMGGASV